MVSRRLGIPFGCIVQDLLGEAARGSGISGGERAAQAVSRAEAWALGQAAVLGLVTGSFRRHLLAYGIPEARFVEFPNWAHVEPAAADAAIPQQRWGQAVSSFVVLHTGNMGLKQDLLNVIDTARLARTSAPHLRFVLVGDGNQRDTIARAASDLDNVSIRPLVTDAEYPALLASADVLLVNERPTVGDMSLPSKLTSYLDAGRPIVAAVSADGACAGELARTKGAAAIVPAGEPERLLHELVRLGLDPASRARMGVRGRQYADAHLSREAARVRAEALVLRLVQATIPAQRTRTASAVRTAPPTAARGR
jgi:colanic acid biosynthesis glycosyl transferase WcaI